MIRLSVITACVALSLPAIARAVPDPPPTQESPQQDDVQAPRSTPPSAEAPTPVLTKPPELTQFVEAEYPQKARDEGRTGTVGLQFTIEADGTVNDIEVVRSAGADLDEAAVMAAAQFGFSPAELDGKPGAVRITYDYAFTLETQVEEVPVDTPDLGVLEGELLERGTRNPLIGVSVKLPDLNQETYTDAKGLFSFSDVPVGEVRIVVEDGAFASIEDSETVEAGKATKVLYRLQRQGFEDVLSVVGRRPRKEVVRRVLSMQEIRTIPGTQGDALKVIQNLPGVARQVFSDELVLRGGGQSQAYLGQHPIPLAFHFGGLRSTVSSGLIETIDVYPGNFGAEFGRLNGGVIDVQLRSPATDRLRGFAEADVFDAGFLLEGPINENWSFAVAGRRSYIDAILPFVLPDDGSVSFNTAPRYYDGQLLLEGRYGKHTLKLTGYLSSDSVAILFDDDDEESDTLGINFGQKWWGGRADWDYRHNERLSNKLSVSLLTQSFDFRGNPGLPEDITFELVQDRITLRDTVRFDATPWLEMRGGTDSELLFASYLGLFPAPRREGEIQPDGPPTQDELRSIDESGVTLSPSLWTEFAFKFGALQLIPGLRLDYFGGPKETFLQPRFSTRYAVTPATTLKAAIGLYAEPPSVDELSAAVGDVNSKSETSVHYSLGFEQRFTDALKLDVVGFYKTLDNLITTSAEVDEVVRNQGVGRAYGMELLLRHDMTSRFFGWVAYTLMRSERRDAPGLDYRPFDLDQTHNVTIVAQYKLTNQWDVGLRWRYVTGNPSTPYIGANYDADTGLYAPISGEVNSDRLGAFHQLDLRTDYHFIYDAWKLTLYLDVQNVYNRANPEGVEYSYDFRESAVESGLPIIPSIGARGEF